jgi:hypothetical protein
MNAFAAKTAAAAIDCQLLGSRTTDVPYVKLTKKMRSPESNTCARQARMLRRGNSIPSLTSTSSRAVRNTKLPITH